MRKRRIYLLAVGVALLVGVIVVVWPERDSAVTPPAEPEYRGRRLSDWVETTHRGHLPTFSRPTSQPYMQRVLAFSGPDLMPLETQDAIRHIGPNAIPFLLRWIRYEPPGLKTKLSALLNETADYKLDDHQSVRAEGAMRALITLSSEAEGAIPELALLMNDPRAPSGALRATAALSLLRLRLLSADMALMTNNSAMVRLDSIRLVGMSGAPINPALPVLIQRLHDKDAEIAASAAQVLGDACLEANLVVPALTKSLQDKRSEVRDAAIQALGRFHRQALLAVPALVIFLTDPNHHIRRRAADALDCIDPGALERAGR